LAVDHPIGRRNVGLFDQCALLAGRVVSTLRPEVDQKVALLTRNFPALDSAELRLRLWIVESTLVLLAGENSGADPARLDRFFGAFWSGISKELHSDLPGQDVRQAFDAGIDRLAAEITSDRQKLAAEKVSMAMGERIAVFLDLPEGKRLASVWGDMGTEYGYKLATSTNLLNQLPE
jgi:hypothetical protein